MKLDQQQQAQNLYFQTDLSKSEIAAFVGVSRRALHYWVQQNNWDRLKKSAQYIPSFLAENCYQALGNLTEHILSEERIGQPVTAQEANTIYKLTLTIAKLKTKATLNENMETFATFTDHLCQCDPALAMQLKPHLDSFIQNQAIPTHTRCRPSKINEAGYIPSTGKAKADREALLDLEDELAWAEEARKENATNAPTHKPAPLTQSENAAKPNATNQSPKPSTPSQQTHPDSQSLKTPSSLGVPAGHEGSLRGEAAVRGKLPRILRHAA